MEKVLLIDGRDNVATAIEPVNKGDSCSVRTSRGLETFVALQNVGVGHKLAIRSIPRGTPVFKYGAPIGDATADISAGEHVHTHNLAGYRGRDNC